MWTVVSIGFKDLRILTLRINDSLEQALKIAHERAEQNGSGIWFLRCLGENLTREESDRILKNSKNPLQEGYGIL